MDAPRRAGDFGWTTPPLLQPGSKNALTDIPGVLVGHSTLIQGGSKPLGVGRGPVVTGVTAIRPHPGNLFEENITAAVHVLNGFGKTTGLEQIRELGLLETPILLTNTLNVWRSADYLLDWMLHRNPEIGISTPGTVNIVVGECNDGWLNDIQGRHVGREHVFAALETASNGFVPEGGVGAGTGTRCYGFKGGIGTASRVISKDDGASTVGVLLQSNFGSREQLTIRGLPVGKWLKEWPQGDPTSQVFSGQKGHSQDDYDPVSEGGSCMMVVATDAPLTHRQLTRVARRTPLGLARTGFTSNPGSGDYVIAFSTNRVSAQPIDDRTLGNLFQGVVESTEEAALNSLVAAQTTAGRDNHVAYAVPVEKIQEWVEPIHEIQK